MKKRALAALLLCLCFLMLSGCWQEDLSEPESLTPMQSFEEEAEAEEEHAIIPEVFSLPYAPGQTLDPITCTDCMQQTISSLLYEGMFRLNPQLEPEACLCESYTTDATGAVYTFTLRAGVTFSDGSALTAADVKATLDRSRTSERYRQRLSGISSISLSCRNTF